MDTEDICYQEVEPPSTEDIQIIVNNKKGRTKKFLATITLLLRYSNMAESYQRKTYN